MTLHHTLHTQWYLDSAPGQRVAETTLRDQIAAFATRFQNEDEFEGALELWQGEHVLLTIEDALPAVVKNLCFAALPELQAGASFVYHYYNHSGELQMHPQPPLVILSGTEIPTHMVDRDALIAALYHAGTRFLALLDQLATQTGSSTIAALRAFLAEQQAQIEPSATHHGHMKPTHER